MPTIIKQANILDAIEDIIVHQVNGLGVMGAGLADRLKKKYPSVYNVYCKYAKKHTPESLLGYNLMVMSNGQPAYQYEKGSPHKLISNIFGQAYVGRGKKPTNDEAVKSALLHLAAYARINHLSIAIPLGMGCRLGGGNWNDILLIIEAVFHDQTVMLYDYGK